jgi:hypothetical protein
MLQHLVGGDPLVKILKCSKYLHRMMYAAGMVTGNDVYVNAANIIKEEVVDKRANSPQDIDLDSVLSFFTTESSSIDMDFTETDDFMTDVYIPRVHDLFAQMMDDCMDS